MKPKGVIAASQPRWIPVTERLPEQTVERTYSSEQVLIYYGAFIKIGNLRCDKWCVHNEVLTRQELVTHWMPLPEPPKEVANAGTP